MWGIAIYLKHSQNWNGKWIAFISQVICKGALLDGYIQILKRSMITQMFNLTFKFFGYISQRDLPNSSLAFIVQRWSVKGFFRWNILPWFYQKKSVMTHILLDRNTEKYVPKIVWRCQLTVFLSHFQRWNSSCLLND